MTDTISAVSTPPGTALRAVVRVSGPGAREAAAPLLLRPVPLGPGRGAAPARLCPFRGGAALPATLLFFPAPGSYTGEDTVEIHLPGNPVVCERVMRRLAGAGARRAGPGEFTRRALENGRIDLTQAEGVLRLLSAAGREGLAEGLRDLSGATGAALAGLREALVTLLARLEAELDFAGEEVRFLEDREIGEALRSAREALRGSRLRLGRRPSPGGRFRVLLAGAPNAGKSTLFNALVGRRRVLESPVPGTTRDLIEGRIEIEGLPVSLFDAPGLGAGPVPGARGDGFDLQLVVLDGGVPVPAPVRRLLEERASPLRVVASKADLEGSAAAAADVARLAPDLPCLGVSGRTGRGLGELRAAIAGEALAASGWSEPSHPWSRRRERLEAAARELRRAERLVRKGGEREMLALHVRAALGELGELAGGVATEEVLDRVFSEFCIGK